MTYEPLFRAIPEERGCGERTPGGLYVESGLGPGGVPLEDFLVDPPVPIPEGLDLVNKPQVIKDPETGIYHLWLWIGAEWYPYVGDYLEETRRLGASRKLNPQLDLSGLTPGSRMILAHPTARNTLWQQQRPPYECAKGIPGHALQRDFHALASVSEAPERPDQPETPFETPSAPPTEGAAPPSPTAREGVVPSPTSALALVATQAPGNADEAGEANEEFSGAPASSSSSGAPRRPALPFGWRYPETPSGPCLFKVYELMPQEAAVDGELPTTVAGRTWYARRIGSTTYFFEPSGESADGLAPGVFATLPITGFALIQHPDGSVNTQAKDKLDASGLPYYCSEH